MARTQAEKQLDTLRKENKLPQSLQDKMKESGEFSRRGRIPGLGANRELARDAFVAMEGEWLPKVYAFDTQYIVARVQSVTPPTEEAWEEQKAFWIQRLSSSRKRNMMDNFVKLLREEAEIEIKAPEILRY